MNIDFTYLCQPPKRYTFEQPRLKAWVERWCKGKVLNLFAGMIKLRVDEYRVDLDPLAPADYHGEAYEFVSTTPMKFDTVVLDPPYDMKQHGKQLPLLFSELVRITAPRGKVIFLAPWIIQNEVLEPKKIWLRPAGIRKGAFPIYKILSISYKTNGQIGDYVNGCV